MSLTLSLPLTRIRVNISTVYNDTLVAKGLMWYVVLKHEIKKWEDCADWSWNKELSS